MKGFVKFVICTILIGVSNALDLPKYRLPNNVAAISYDIKIQPNIINSSFYGETDIFVELQQYLRYIALNMKDLVIERLILDNSLANFTVDKESEMIFIHHTDFSYIDPGEHLIHMEYTGIIRTESTGLFKGVVRSEGKEFVSVATMFSAPYARTVFPCLDEPAYKSRFSIRLIAPDDSFTALSNMEEISSLDTENGRIVDFQTTPQISPYLVCFVLTQYNYKSSTYTSSDGRRIPLRMFMVDEFLDQAEFFLKVTEHALQFFENYTNVTYPVSKLDFIEVPHFIYEGMENIGLVVLTHNSISYNASYGINKVEHQRNAALLIVHEIAHMWFGDIVTPKWYNDLWLAEGFAQFMEIKGLDDQYPTWQLVGMDGILRKDFLFLMDNAPIVIFPINNAQVDEQFSDIVYDKGNVVLKMLEMTMGASKFQQGVRKFLGDFFMNSATTGNFISIMQSFTPSTNLRGFLETWLYQDGFPLLTVSRKNDSYILRQRSFQMKSKNISIFGRKWTIPITFINSENNSEMIWFDKDAETLSIPSFNFKWIKFNYKAISLYRVLYTDELYQQLLNNFEELDQVDQANLIFETYHLFSENLIPCEIPLKFIGKLKKKDGILPSLASFRVMNRVMKLFQNHLSIRSKLREYFIETFKDMYEKLKWRVQPQEDLNVRFFRSFLLEALCSSDIAYEKCIEDAKTTKQDDGAIHGDLLHVWRQIMTMKNRSDVIDNNEITNSSTSLGEKDAKTQLFLDKCGSWIEMNL